MKKLNVSTIWWGLKEFQEIEKLQKSLWEIVNLDPQKIFFIGGEVNPVVTLGKNLSNKSESKLDLDLDSDISIEQTDRGGGLTVHSPGQLIVYPILNLDYLNLGKAKSFVQLIEDSIVECLKEFPITLMDPSELDPNEIGIFTINGKLASFGFRIEKSISRHGFSINIANDLSLFSPFIICGKKNRPMDKLENWNIKIDLQKLFNTWCDIFLLYLTQRNSECKLVEVKRSLGAVGSAFP